MNNITTTRINQNGFVTLQNGDLRDGAGLKLRFLSFNVPNLAVIEVPWRRTTEWEQRDALRSIQLLGGRVLRVYTFSIQNPIRPFTHISFENGEPKLNEDLFADFDRALALAREYNLYVIVPFIDRWEWWGGAQTFSSLVNPSYNSLNDFFTQQAVRDKFKTMIRLILNRNNTVTGIPYKNDSTILCWETGNELETATSGPVPGEWTADIARYIKSIDSNHLVMDGSFGRNGWDAELLKSSSPIDILSNHYYIEPISLKSIDMGQWFSIAALSCMFLASVAAFIWFVFFKSRRLTGTSKKSNPSVTARIVIKVLLPVFSLLSLCGIALTVVWKLLYPNYEQALMRDARTAAGIGKVFIAGEFGLTSLTVMKPMIRKLIGGTGAGALIWSLRSHSSNGGFYTHKELGGYWAYHFPGLPENQDEGFGSDEIAVLDMMKTNSFLLANQTGYNVVNLTTLDPPVLLNASFQSNRVYLTWRGSTGASSYTIEQSKATPAGPFTRIASNVLDNKRDGNWIFEDMNPAPGMIFYRVIATSSGLMSAASNVFNVTAS